MPSNQIAPTGKSGDEQFTGLCEIEHQCVYCLQYGYLTENDHAYTNPNPKSNKHFYVLTVLGDTDHTEKLQSTVPARELLRPAPGRAGKYDG